MADKQLETKLVHAGRSKKYTLGSVNSVIQRASSLVFDTLEAKKQATHNRANGALFLRTSRNPDAFLPAGGDV